jgi:hypothetical protein
MALEVGGDPIVVEQRVINIEQKNDLSHIHDL